jgi:uncharacterized caspase-like protein
MNQDALYATAYPMVELANAVATRMRSLRTALILDTCYSAGSIHADASLAASVPASAPNEQMLKHMTEGTGRIVLAASGVNEESRESADLKHGYFTYFLLRALQQGKGRTPLSQIFASVSTQVSQQVSTQHPVMSRSSAGDDFALGADINASASLHP